MTDEELMREAVKARRMAYAPYSRFMVGAALITVEGRLYTGCNIENAAYGPSNCAERTAFFCAVKEGERSFEAIAVAGGMEGTDEDALPTCTPCGVCRQVMREFCSDSFRIIVAGREKGVKTYHLSDLLPDSFGPDNLDS